MYSLRQKRVAARPNHATGSGPFDSRQGGTFIRTSKQSARARSQDEPSGMSLPMSLRAPIRKSRVASDSVARDRSRRVHGIQSVRKLVDVDQVGNLSDEYENTGLFYPDADEDTHDDFEAVVDIQGVVNREARAEIPDFGADMNRVMEVDPTKEPYGQADSAGELRADADTRANVDAEADEHPNSNTREFDRT
jgi:hypothetical protein